MNNILISGYYGFNNLGDEAILEAMIKSFKQLDEPVSVTVMTATPEQTQKDLGIQTIDRYHLLAVLKAVWKTDVLVSGGGSLLQDSTSKQSIHYYLAVILFGLLMGKKVMLYAHGIGPVTKPLNRKIMKFLLRRVHAITVREENSLHDLVSMGIERERVTVTADPVVATEKYDPKVGLDILKRVYPSFQESRKTVGLSVRTKDFRDQSKKDELQGLVDRLGERYNIVLIPFHQKEDIEISAFVGQNVGVINGAYSAREILSVVENLDVLIGVRLHSLIFAATAGIPLVGISYDPKIDYFLDTLGLRSFCDIEDFQAERIEQAVEDVLGQSGEMKRILQERVEVLRTLFDRNTHILKTLLSEE